MRAILIIALLFSVGLVFAASNPPSKKPIAHTDSSTQNANPNQRGTEQSPLFVNIKTVPEFTQIERNEKAAEKYEKSQSDWWLIKLTGALVGVTLLLVVVTGFLWSTTKRLVQGAEDTAKRQLRAYISAEPTAARDAEGKAIDNVVAVYFKNTGQTPARKFKQWTVCKFDKFPRETGFDERPQDITYSETIIHPDGDRWIIPTLPDMTDKIKTSLASGKYAIYIFGEGTYEDVFGAPHVTTFRFFMDKVGAAHQRFAYYPTGNDAT